MGRREVLRDRRRSSQNIHVGKVSIFKRAASWCIYYRENGKPRRIRIGPDREEAERQAAEVNAQLAHGVPSTYGFERITVEELIRLWLEHHELVLRSSVATVKRYGAAVAHLQTFVRELQPGLTADGLTPRTAESFVKYLRRTEVSPNGHRNTKKRVLRDKGLIFILGTCRALFNYAARQRHLPPYAENPFSGLGIERMKVEDAKPTGILTPEEEARFLGACDEWQFPVFFTLAFTGMRPGELCHLRVEDIDLAGNMLHIRNRPELGWRTKTRSARRVPLFPELRQLFVPVVEGRAAGPLFRMRRFVGDKEVAVLADLSVPELAQELLRRISLGRDAKGEAWTRNEEAKLAKKLWRETGALTEKCLRMEFIKLTKRIDRPDLTCPKLWRHQMATAMQSADVDPFVRKELIGHTRLETTRLYTHTQTGTLGAQMGKVLNMRRDVLGLARERLGS